LTLEVAKGDARTVECVVRPSGKAPAKEFLDNELESISEKGQDKPSAKTHFMALFNRMASYGEQYMGKRFKHMTGSLYAFRSEVKNMQVRFPCFRDGDKWILTHGFVKPGAKKGLGDWPPNQIELAEKIMGEYLQKKKAAEAKRGNK
jgi:hypothetical protein